MNIIDVLQKENINLNLAAEKKNEAITELLELLKKNSLIANVKEVKKAILEREAIISTGIGKGIGVPHCRTIHTDKIILAVGRSKKSIEDYESFDEEPVKLIFLLISPEDEPNEHINMLARISRILKQDFIRNSLLSATSAKKFYEILKNEDKRFL